MEPRQMYRLSQRLKLPPGLRHFQPSSTQMQIQMHSRHTSSKPSAPSQRQAIPIGDYYASILNTTLPSSSAVTTSPATTASPSNPPITTSPSSDPEPSILFSSRLSSPLERRSEIQKKSTMVAGVWIPPRPDEPDNCCMSGCVNCVWDRYRDEVEEWATARREADAALQKQKIPEKGKRLKKSKTKGIEETGLMLGKGENGARHTMVSMDDDGGGSESNWGTGLDTEFTSEGFFKGLPVGIREFMKQEKRLKEKHAREAKESAVG